MRAIFYTHDLMISSQATGAARASNCELQMVRSLQQLDELLGAGDVELVILDLEAPGIAVDAAVTTIKQSASTSRIVAFGPHVWTDQLAGAQQSGCDQVMSRGEFTRNLKDLLSSA